MPMPLPQQGPARSGGNDPVKQAALSNLRGGGGMTPATPPMQAPGGAPGAGAPIQGQGSEVGMHLAAAFEALLRTGPSQQNLSALESFWRAITQLSPQGQQPQAPLGQAPGNTPLPPAPPPAQAMGGVGSPMVPPRQV